MLDVCILAEGAWPARTGGLSRWTSLLSRALDGAEVGVVGLGGAAAKRGTEASHDVTLASLQPELRRLPAAHRYVSTGIESAEALLRYLGSGQKVVHVEHGDAVREAALGCRVNEGEQTVRQVQAAELREVARRRARVVREAGVFVSVTERGARRARTEGARRPRVIENAVPAPAARSRGRTGLKPGFVGRLAHVKGIDRLSELASLSERRFVVSGLPSGDQRTGVDDWADLRLDADDPWDAPIGALLMPSRSEASPFAALEAESLGIPACLTPAADISTSPLLRIRDWSPDSWKSWLDQALEHGTHPSLGRRIAQGRWTTFRHSWKQVLQ